MNENENHSTGPRTEEGKQRSSQNSLKHALFFPKTFLLPGESQEDFDRLLYHYTREHNPKGQTEEDQFRFLAQTEWRRRRIPALEADSIQKALDSGDADRKFMHTYSIYDQRFNRTIQTTLKFLADLQARRKRETAVNFRLALILYKHNKANQIRWNPADDGFVFSTAVLDRQLDLVLRVAVAQQSIPHDVTDNEFDLFFAQPVM